MKGQFVLVEVPNNFFGDRGIEDGEGLKIAIDVSHHPDSGVFISRQGLEKTIKRTYFNDLSIIAIRRGAVPAHGDRTWPSCLGEAGGVASLI